MRRGRTLAAMSSLDGGIAREGGQGASMATAAKVGQVLAERALAAGVTEVVFDRGGYRYHGRVKALAEAAREGGLKL